jgi:hypothetical protein
MLASPPQLELDLDLVSDLRLHEHASDTLWEPPFIPHLRQLIPHPASIFMRTLALSTGNSPNSLGIHLHELAPPPVFIFASTPPITL